jgi:exodeoxyribonuclease V alpha subunit
MNTMNQYYELTGVVTELVYKSNDKFKPTIFTLKTANNVGYKVECSYFCPVSAGDACHLTVSILDKEKKIVKAVKQPFVTLPMDKDNTIQFFMKTLKGQSFGPIGASKLYDDLAKYAKQLQYGEGFVDKKEITKDYEYKAINNEDRYKSDGVIPFLSETAAEYCDTRNDKIIDLLVGKNGESAGNIAGVSRLKSTLTRAQARKLLDEWHNKRSLRRLYLLSLTRTEIINSGFNLDELYYVCLTNPYRVASINYDKCENILNSIGKVANEEMRLFGRINRYVYDSSSSKGWSCIPLFLIKKSFPEFESKLKSNPNFLNEYGMVLENDRLYVKSIYNVEKSVSQFIHKAIIQTAEIYEEDKLNSDMIIGNFYECKTLTDEQKTTVNNALKASLSLICGGGGTGKSTIIREIARNLSIRGIGYVVCSFTGKAVSRLHEIMKNKNAITIDRFIMKTKERKVNDSKFDISAIKHIIIDEASMVTTELFYRLLQQLDTNVSITFVGDLNQLPAIGWGSLMKELINCGRIPTFYLTKNQRIQSTVSTGDTSETNGEKYFDRAILENANNLINNKRNLAKPLEFVEGAGFYILNGSKETVGNVATALKTAGYGCDDLVVISPYRQPLKDLNVIVQDIFFPEGSTMRYEQETPTGVRVWAVGDKVMMNANNYKINIFNGDIGTVVSLNEHGVNVRFDDESEHLFKYTPKEEEEDGNSDVDEKSDSDELFVHYLTHAFAMSVHKSQGSEYKFVILYLESKGNFNNFLNINLLYTAITRAKQTLWIVCDKKVLIQASSTPSPLRYDGLGYMLKATKDELKEKILEVYTLNPIFDTSLSSATALTSVGESNDYDNTDMFDLYASDFEDD